MILPEIYCQRKALDKLSKRVSKVLTVHSLYVQYFRSLLHSSSTFQSALSLSESLSSQSTGFLCHNQDSLYFVNKLINISNCMHQYSRQISARFEVLFPAQLQQLQNRVAQRIQTLVEESVRYKKVQYHYNSQLLVYKQTIKALHEELDRYYLRQADPHFAYDVTQQSAARVTLVQKNKNLINFQITLKHQYEKVCVRNKELKQCMASARNVLFQSIAIVLKRLIDCGMTAFGLEKPAECKDNQARMVQIKYCDLLPQNYQKRVSQYLIENAIVQGIKRTELSLRQKKLLVQYVRKVRLAMKSVLNGAKDQESRIFGANNKQKFDKNIKKYFGQTYYRFYFRVNNRLHFFTRILQSAYTDLGEAQASLKHSVQLFQASLRESANQLKSYLSVLKKGRGQLNQFPQLCQDLKKICAELQLKQQFSQRIIGDIMRKSSQKLEQQFRKQAASLLRGRIQQVIRPLQSIKQAMQADQKKAVVLFHPFFSNPLAVAVFDKSKQFSEILKQTQIKIGTIIDCHQRNRSVGCFSSQVKYFKSYSCCLQQKISLLGKLQVNSYGVAFNSSFNSTNLLFGSTYRFVPRKQIIDVKLGEPGQSQRLVLVTKKGNLNFTSFYRREKARTFIYKQFQLGKQAGPVPVRSDPPTKYAYDMNSSFDQINLSLWASQIMRDSSKQAIKQSFDYSIEIPPEWTLSECLAQLKQFHRQYIQRGHGFVSYKQEQSVQRFEYSFVVGALTFAVKSTVEFRSNASAGTGTILCKLQSFISRERKQEKITDFMKINLTFSQKRLTYSFGKQAKHAVYTFYEIKLAQELRRFYAALLEDFQFRRKESQFIIPEALKLEGEQTEPHKTEAAGEEEEDWGIRYGVTALLCLGAGVLANAMLG